ncbi:MAG: PRC-barrel domain-containing protein [Pseudomonadota bacterium]
MADPVSYLMIEPGWEVVGSDGARVGDVREVLADMSADIFDGLAVDVGIRSIRYVAAEHVAEIVEGRVVLTQPAAAASSLPQWRGTPGG